MNKNDTKPIKTSNDFDVYGYEYYGYGIDERKRRIETDDQLRKFILKRKKKTEKPSTPN